jgi:hypothetical protein
MIFFLLGNDTNIPMVPQELSFGNDVYPPTGDIDDEVYICINVYVCMYTYMLILYVNIYIYTYT